MYLEALESEVESLSAEVTRLRIMLQRVTQVMEFPVSVEALPSYRDPVAASLSRAEPRAANTGTTGTAAAGSTINVPVELLQLLLEQHQQLQQRDTEKTATKQKEQRRKKKTFQEAPKPRRVFQKSEHSLDSGADTSTDNENATDSEEPSESEETSASSRAAPSRPVHHKHSASTPSSGCPLSSADKSKEKISSTVTRHSASSSITRPTPTEETNSASTRNSAAVVNPVTAEWRLPSPMKKTVPPLVQRPPQLVVVPPPHSSDDNAKDESRATHNTRHSNSNSVMPTRRISAPVDASVAESATSTSDAPFAGTSHRGSEGTALTNSAWASAINGYFDGASVSARMTPQQQQQRQQPLSQSEMGSVATGGAGAPSVSAAYTNQSIEFSQQAMFSYSMLGSLANPSPVMSSVKARSATPATHLDVPVVEEVVDDKGRTAVEAAARATNNTVTEELPSSSHVMNSKKVPRQTSVMTYRSDDSDDDEGGANARTGVEHSGVGSPSPLRLDAADQRTRTAQSGGAGVPLAPAVLGVRRGTLPPSAHRDESPENRSQRAGSAPAMHMGTPGSGIRTAQLPHGGRTQVHKKSVFDILREQAEDSSDSDATSSASSSPERDASKGTTSIEESQAGRVAPTRSLQEMGSASNGTARDAYSAGFYSPQLTPQESPAADPIGSPGASLPPDASYMGYEYDLGLETSQSRSRSLAALPGKDDGEDMGKAGYYPI